MKKSSDFEVFSTVFIGLPQGSIIGPFLLICIEDGPHSSILHDGKHCRQFNHQVLKLKIEIDSESILLRGYEIRNDCSTTCVGVVLINNQ